MKIYDYIVVGSGCAGSIAAHTLQASGAKVAMVDVGIGSQASMPLPALPYPELREKDPEQFKYLIGERGEGINFDAASKGAQITPPRVYMTAKTDQYIPVRSQSFQPVESLAYGGLGVGWGLGCWQFSDNELQAAGLNSEAMKSAYQAVSEIIGISAQKDDAEAYTIRSLKGYLPAPKPDRNHQKIHAQYVRHKAYFEAAGFTLGRVPLALLTKDRDNRKAYTYNDTDFYTDHNMSAWRPWMLVDELKKNRNFTYTGGKLAVGFSEKKAYAELTCLDTATKQPFAIRGRRIILATGALNTARIVLRSFNDYTAKLPFLCNPYSYLVTLQPGLLGSGLEESKLGFAQFSLFFDKSRQNIDVDMASTYSYQSLMLHRAIGNMPLNYKHGAELMKFMLPGTVILGIHHPDKPSAQKYIQLTKDKKSPTGDALAANYRPAPDEEKDRLQRVGHFKKASRKLGLLPVKHVRPPYGSSIHYAGTLPVGAQKHGYYLETGGRLHGTKKVYVADSSGFTYLPAKGLTFSLMANSYHVARGLLHGN